LLGSCQQAGHLSVNSAWSRPTSEGSNGAAYFTINNPTPQQDFLVAARCDIATQVEIHMSNIRDDGVMEMVTQKNVPVDPGSSVKFEPGGLHVMLVNLQQDLNPGDTFELSLQFQNAGEIPVNIEVLEN
jgi:copper(I)-binding protein